MSQELSTVIVFVPFVIIAAAVIILALFWVYDRIRPLIDNFAVAKSAASGEDSDASDEHDDGREKPPPFPVAIRGRLVPPSRRPPSERSR